MSQILQFRGRRTKEHKDVLMVLTNSIHYLLLTHLSKASLLKISIFMYAHKRNCAMKILILLIVLSTFNKWIIWSIHKGLLKRKKYKNRSRKSYIPSNYGLTFLIFPLTEIKALLKNNKEELFWVKCKIIFSVHFSHLILCGR